MTRKQMISMSVSMLCGIFIAEYLVKVWDPYWAWFIGGVIMSLGLQFTVPASIVKKVGVTLLTGVVASVAYNLTSLLGL